MTTPREQNRGFHAVLDEAPRHLFIDTCMQAWPDADWPVAHRHGCTVFGVTAFMPNGSGEGALEGLMHWHLMARKHENVVVVETVDDIRAAHREGKAGLLLASQDGDFLGRHLHRLEAFYRLGLRMMLPAYNSSNLICGGCLERTDRGLTAFGRLVVREANRVGLLLDGTHVGERSSLEMIDASEDPVVFSHANPASLFPNPRNLSDAQIRAAAASGGVIGVVPWGPLCLRPGQRTRPTLEALLDAVDYVAQLTGSIDYVGIGTDFSLGSYPAHPHDPWGQPISLAPVMADYNAFMSPNSHNRERFVEGFSSYPEIVGVAAGLQGRGYSETDVAKVLGENWLRVFERVWKPVG